MNEVTPDAGLMDEEREARPGTLLRRAREDRGMSIGDVAEVTRIAQRQLEAIERSDFASLPGTPYAVGFARAYARAVGADEVEIAKGVREELGMIETADRYEAFEPVDPARIPPRSLAWTAAAIALLLAVAYGVWRTQFFAASTDEEISDISNRAGQAAPSAVSPPAAGTPSAAAIGPVVLTALGDVWLRIYDRSGERLFERQMAKGESYTVPPDANDPMILTGRPDALAVTVGGKPVAPLGPPERTIADVPVSAAALLSRPAARNGDESPAVQPGGGAQSSPTSTGTGQTGEVAPVRLPTTSAVPRAEARPSSAPVSASPVPAGRPEGAAASVADTASEATTAVPEN